MASVVTYEDLDMATVWKLFPSSSQASAGTWGRVVTELKYIGRPRRQRPPGSREIDQNHPIQIGPGGQINQHTHPCQNVLDPSYFGRPLRDSASAGPGERRFTPPLSLCGERWVECWVEFHTHQFESIV